MNIVVEKEQVTVYFNFYNADKKRQQKFYLR